MPEVRRLCRTDELLHYIKDGTDDRIYAIAQLLRLGCGDGDMICIRYRDRPAFPEQDQTISWRWRKTLKDTPGDTADAVCAPKQMGFSDDGYRASLGDGGRTRSTKCRRKARHVPPVYKMIDTCASEFDSYIPYFYSTYEEENESVVSGRKEGDRSRLGSHPHRAGRGVRLFHRARGYRRSVQSGYEAIIINNNPETVSTDYTCSDKLYFEPLCAEDVMNIIELGEAGRASSRTLGGQTAINLAEPLAQARRDHHRHRL